MFGRKTIIEAGQINTSHADKSGVCKCSSIKGLSGRHADKLSFKVKTGLQFSQKQVNKD